MRFENVIKTKDVEKSSEPIEVDKVKKVRLFGWRKEEVEEIVQTQEAS